MAVGDNTKGLALRPFERTRLKNLEKSLAKAKKMKDFYSGKGGDSGKVNVFQKQMDKINKKLAPLQNRVTKKQDFKRNPLKISNKGLTPARTLVKGESKISRATMMGGTPPGGLDEKKKVKKYDPTKANRAGQRMGQRKAGGMIKKMAYGGKVKKMMGGGMAMKYGDGGTVSKSKKCPRDGIAMRGKTRA
tara:strand:- start:22 stop:591 length:570 start_codon:yes stop_codon:yes gene_type:complete